MVAAAAYAVVGGFLGVWFALSVVANLLPRDSGIRRMPFSWALPEWRFFAPTPATHDYEVFFRVRSPGGLASDPEFVAFPDRLGKRMLFNPHSRTRKATRDAIDDLLSAADNTSSEGHPTGTNLGLNPASSASAGYAAVLREVRQLAGSTSANHVQFGVLFLQGRKPPRLVFVSRWHPTR
jgi:hypothetical protein